MSAILPSCDHEKQMTGVFRSLMSSMDQRPSYLIQTKMMPEESQEASFWYGSFHLTSVTWWPFLNNMRLTLEVNLAPGENIDP
jgi:hypothetical protein